MTYNDCSRGEFILTDTLRPLNECPILDSTIQPRVQCVGNTIWFIVGFTASFVLSYEETRFNITNVVQPTGVPWTYTLNPSTSFVRDLEVQLKSAIIAISITHNNGNFQFSYVIKTPSTALGLPESDSQPATHSLKGEIYTTQDGNYIGSAKFTVLEFGLVKVYQIYNPKVQNVVKCCYMNTVSFIKYSMLRLLLSKLLFHSVFNVNYLRQRYYCKFKQRLRDSIWCYYDSYFKDDPYWELFKH